ncbi:MAG: recombinase family protein [Candidatus Staskawiczbacteria bacterium]|jgi:DNA invertase Pin-like site-specific DNA recombinase
MTTDQIKAIIYCRVSSKEQEETGYSLDSQEKLLTEYAIKNNFKIEKVYRISESASGKQLRKTFDEILRVATQTKSNAILCEKIDRLTRNLKDAATVDDWIKENLNRAVHFVKENFVLNQQTRAHENLVWDMKVAIARFYTNNLSEEVKKGQKEKLAQGWFPQKPPPGYKTTGDKGHKTHIIDESKAPLVRKMFELFDTGNFSIGSLADKMYEDGLRNENGKKIGKSSMHRYLSDPFYCGKNRWNGEISKGEQILLISKELFESVQLKLRRYGNSHQYKKYKPVFQGKIKCMECGSVITWYTKKGHWYGFHNKYKKCSFNRTCLKQADVEKQMFGYFDNIAPKNIRIIKWLEETMKENHTNEVDYNAIRREELSRIIEYAGKRIEKAYIDKLDGRAPLALCEKVIADSDREKKDATESLDKLGQSKEKYYQAGYAIHELALNAVGLYKSDKATTDQKRLMLSIIFSNFDLNDKNVRENYTFGFEFIAKWMNKVNSTFELDKTGEFTNKTSDFSPVLNNQITKLRR